MKVYIDAHVVNNCSAFSILAQGQSDIQYFTESANMTRVHFIPFALKIKLCSFLTCNIFFFFEEEGKKNHINIFSNLRKAN